MASSALQWVGLLLGGAGAAGAVAATIMPQWKVSAFIGSNIVVFETLWEGLWMSCRSHTGLRLQCKVYDSLLALPADLQAARGLMCAACALAALAALAAALGMRCCSGRAGAEAKAKGATLLAAGILFAVVGVAVLAPVSWVAAAIVRDFYDPTLDDGRKRELGEALYLGWVSALLLVAGGAVLACVAYVPRESGGPRYRLPARRAAPRSWRSERKPGSVPSRSQYV